MLRTTLRLYQWTSLAFVIGFLVLIIIDDFVLLKNISSLGALGAFLLAEFVYLLMYFLVFTVCYWAIAALIILVFRLLKK